MNIDRYGANAAPPWTGVVLAGGKSSRMGRDKASLSWKGQPLLQHMHDLLLRAGAARVVVSGDHPEYKGIPDPVPERGPIGGLAGIVENEPDGTLLIVPIDMPKLSPALLRRLIDDTQPAASLCIQGHMLPLRLKLDQRLRSVLADIAGAGPPHMRSLHCLHAALDGIDIDIDARHSDQLLDSDTPEQWEALQA
ncbi:MAG: molybdenum cofactor guanylyltransferase [Xanthomonadaceae bacterium]|jgi:molybdopterin-guanine dinucleotide biosynthesis protein A|nr:molybdenum cofactor guanylyltransferase [Xanthomonadaceae bacterium]